MERATIVTVDFDKRESWTAGERSDELGELAASAGAKVIHRQIVNRNAPSPATFIGSGKAEEIGIACAEEKIDLVIFNNDLTPSQQKNLEEIMKARVIDRTQLILDIFARRAHSNEGKLQVELAQLSYMLPRLMDQGLQMSRPGGGIGTSGPGEQKLEVDRRRVRDRISRLKGCLTDLGKRRGMMRRNRSRLSMLTVAFVGYTNVGKSTLLNSLTSSNAFVQDKLFATLDPTVRKFVMPNKQKVLFIDTVGFIKDLPHHLVEAFKATLEEVTEADLLLHVVDSSHPKAIEQAEAVYEVLRQIKAIDRPRITALNKIDKIVDSSVVERLKGHFVDPIEISALKREGLDGLISKITSYLKGATEVVNITMPAGDARTLNLIYENGLISKQEYVGDQLIIEAEIPIRLKDVIDKSYFQ